jgi:uncharacterized protein (DUF2141 family)
VTVNGGLVYTAVYSNEADYKNDNKYTTFVLPPDNTVLTYTLDLPAGEYAVSVFQDTNSNKELDTRVFGLPAEPIGITNYTRRGVPGGFHTLKVPVNGSSTRITVTIGKVKLL